MPNICVTFKMTNGSILECRYRFYYRHATFDSPAEGDASDPVYYIDDVEVSQFPKGLEAIAEEMYDNWDDSRFEVTYPEDEPEGEPEPEFIFDY